MTDVKPLVLFVDDLPDLRELYAVAVSQYSFGFDAVFAEDVESAMRMIRERSPAAVVLDVNLAGETGMLIADHLSEFYPGTPKAVLTAYDLAGVREAAEAHGMEVWPKPIMNRRSNASSPRARPRGRRGSRRSGASPAYCSPPRSAYSAGPTSTRCIEAGRQEPGR
jgi:DNA-binding NtrC family response regulator